MNKKIVFMGTPSFAVPILKSLYQNGCSISLVYTQPPQKSDRGQKINKSPIQLLSETINLEVRTPFNLKNNEKEKNILKDLKIDLGIVVAYGQIIPKDILEISKYGWINVHASLLPKYRGAAPIQRAIMAGEDETGISIMKINEKLDSGPVSKNYSIKILKNENNEELSNRLSSLAAEKILENVEDIFEGKAIFKDQINENASYAKKIKKAEGEIFWKESAEKIIRNINGLYPYPGAWFTYNGERYKILKAEISNGKGIAGKLISENFEIACGENSIKVLEIQREGKKVQKIKEFMLGTKIKKDTDLNHA